MNLPAPPRARIAARHNSFPAASCHLQRKTDPSRPTRILWQQNISCGVDERRVTGEFFFRKTVSRSVHRGSQKEPNLRHRNHDHSTWTADSNDFMHARVEVGDVLENLKGSYELKELAWKLNLRRRHQQDLEVGFAVDMGAEVLQPRFLHIDGDHLVKV